MSALLVNNAHMPEVYAMLIHLLLGIRTPFIPASMVSWCLSNSTAPQKGELLNFFFLLTFFKFTFDGLYNHLVHVISTDPNAIGLCEEVIPPGDFFLQRISLLPNGGTTGVIDFTPLATTPATTESTSAQQTMHNSNPFDTVACPEAATIIISILSALMRPVSRMNGYYFREQINIKLSSGKRHCSTSR